MTGVVQGDSNVPPDQLQRDSSTEKEEKRKNTGFDLKLKKKIFRYLVLNPRPWSRGPALYPPDYWIEMLNAGQAPYISDVSHLRASATRA